MTAKQEERFSALLENFVNGNISDTKAKVLGMQRKTLVLFINYLKDMGSHGTELNEKILSWS